MTDRGALRELVGAYAEHVDRREFDQAAELFVPDGRLTVRGRQTRGRAAIREAFHALERYDQTRHVIGDHDVEVNAEAAFGTTHCVAHHLDAAGDRVLVIRYVDAFVIHEGTWRIAHRELLIDSEETRAD